ncbi:MAG: MAPEG family protein [Pseudomonadota bacterium]
MSFPVIAAGAAGLLICLQQALMMNVGFTRSRLGVGAGTGDDRTLERRMRRHANLAENAALFIAALALAELAGAPSLLLLGVTGLFVVARISHAIGFVSEAGSHLVGGGGTFLALRAAGAAGTALSGFVLGAYLLYLAIGSGAAPV